MNIISIETKCAEVILVVKGKMNNKSIMLSVLCMLIAPAFFSGCVTMPNASNFMAPKVTLSSVEVPYHTGYWYYSKKTEPTRGTAGNHGAPMMVSFIFDIHNPNPYPVKMEELRFSVLFEEFEVNAEESTEVQWIPAGMTNQLRVPAMFDVPQTVLTLLLPNAMKLNERGVTPWQLLEKWWTGAPDASFPISAAEGAAVFKAGNLMEIVNFDGKYP